MNNIPKIKSYVLRETPIDLVEMLKSDDQEIETKYMMFSKDNSDYIRLATAYCNHEDIVNKFSKECNGESFETCGGGFITGAIDKEEIFLALNKKSQDYGQADHKKAKTILESYIKNINTQKKLVCEIL